MRNVAYITSGKVGLHRFTYNELLLLEEKEVNFNLCLTQLNEGPCMPEKNWLVHTAGKYKAATQFLRLLFSNKRVLTLFLESYKLKVLPYFLIALSFYKDVKQSGITSIHCQMGGPKLYIGYFLKKLLKKPLTVTVHAHELYHRDVYDQSEKLRNLYANCDKVVTISDFNSSILNKQFLIDKEKLEIMRLFPDIDNLNYVKDKAKILIVANWVGKKGYDVLFKAIKNLNRNDFVLWVVGGSFANDDAIDVDALVDKYDLKDQIAVLGRQGSPILDILFESCDFFCLPSYTNFYADGNPSDREGIPVALMEAMAWGKPVITTDHAGNSELVSDILVKEKDVEGLADAIKYLLENRDKWVEMGKNNQKIVQDKFSKSNIDKLVSIFDSF